MQNINTKTLIAFACALYFLIASILIHFLRPDLGFISEPLSRYAIGDFSILLTIGFLAIGICEILVGIDCKPIMLGSIFLMLAGICMLFGAMLKMDLGSTVSVHGQIHNCAALSEFTLFPIAIFLIAAKMPRGKFKKYSILTAIFTLGLMVTLVVLFYMNSMKFFGLVQKINIISDFRQVSTN
jgi:hypothetical protein